MKIKKILIANRGEIACRIMQTCQKLNITTVAIYAEIERNARHVKMADEAHKIHSDTPTSAYLEIDQIIDIAKNHHVDAIHPGYGFLSERSEFAQAIDKAGLIFIGAPVAALDLMGSKAAAKQTMLNAGVECVPGYHGDNQDSEFLNQQGDKIGYPLLIKASAGGGGKGMKIVDDSSQFLDALHSAKREGKKSFGSDHVILERFITQPKHIEVQVFADSFGNVVHLFERDCSSQRRYQKIVEEAPATCISDQTKNAMYSAAISATKAVNYQGAGTIEFIVEGDEFFFMEMNTRLQVEHRVTELITNTDLVEWQIKVASKEPLPLKQEHIKSQGHAIQARIYAEDSFNGFLPSTGLLQDIKFHHSNYTIIDTGVEKNNNISIHFDPMIAKTVVWANDRQECIDKVLDNLDRTCILGVKTNLAFLSALITSDTFIDNTLFTNALDNGSLLIEPPKITNHALSTLIYHWVTNNRKTTPSAFSSLEGWSNTAPYFNQYSWLYESELIQTKAKINSNSITLLTENDGKTECAYDPNAIFYENEYQIQLIINHQRYTFDKINHTSGSLANNQSNITSPMPGKILDIRVNVGDNVDQEETLVVMEAMKMELTLKASLKGVVKSIHVKTNDVISANTLLIELEE